MKLIQNDKINTDQFLYLCLDFEQRYRLERNADRDHFVPTEGKSAEDLVVECGQFYEKKFPELFTGAQLTYENLDLIIPPIVMLTKDIGDIYRFINGKALQDVEENQAYFKAIEELLVGKLAGSLLSLVQRYIVWVYANVPAAKQVEFGERPPVGRFLPYLGRRSFERRPVSTGKGERESGRDRSSGGKSKDDFSRVSDRQTGSVTDGRKRPDSQYSEEELIQEVKDAAKKLRSEGELEEVRLKSVNSFYRRVQHFTAKEEGLYSYSAGEGSDRSVVVSLTKRESGGSSGPERQ